MAHGLVAVQCRGHQNVGAEIRPECLAVLDQLAEEWTAVETVRDVPGELGEDGEEGSAEVGDAEVQDEVVHARELLPRPSGEGE